MCSEASPSRGPRGRAPLSLPCPSSGFEAFAPLLLPLVRGLARKALARTGTADCPMAVDDLVQDSLHRLLAHGPERFAVVAGRGERGLVGYLASLVQRVVIDQWRAAGATKRWGGMSAVLYGGNLEATLADPRADPESLLLARERLRLLFAAAGAIFPPPVRRRNVTILGWAWIEGWNSPEISYLLRGRLRPTSIDTLLCRVRRRLGEQGLAVTRRPACNRPARQRPARHRPVRGRAARHRARPL